MQFNEWFGTQPEDPQPRIFLDRHCLDEAGSMQQAEMPARSRRTHAQADGNLAGPLWFVSQDFDNPTPRWIGERGKGAVDCGAGRR
jgi:hypothetical protein